MDNNRLSIHHLHVLQEMNNRLYELVYHSYMGSCDDIVLLIKKDTFLTPSMRIFTLSSAEMWLLRKISSGASQQTRSTHVGNNAAWEEQMP